MVWQATIKGTGKAAENAALSFLKQHGLLLLERNFAYRGGEIDLIMKEGTTTVFCEVRYRQPSAFGNAIDSITKEKKIKIARTATYYLQRRKQLNKTQCRFDVLAIQPGKNSIENKLSIQWIKNAFDA